jgi:hypothetical protein
MLYLVLLVVGYFFMKSKESGSGYSGSGSYSDSSGSGSDGSGTDFSQAASDVIDNTGIGGGLQDMISSSPENHTSVPSDQVSTVADKMKYRQIHGETRAGHVIHKIFGRKKSMSGSTVPKETYKSTHGETRAGHLIRGLFGKKTSSNTGVAGGSVPAKASYKSTHGESRAGHALRGLFGKKKR